MSWPPALAFCAIWRKNSPDSVRDGGARPARSPYIGRMNEAIEHPRDDKEAAFARTAIRVTLAGFALMGVAAALMWTQFGPNMFIDLATAVMNCF